MRSDIHLQIILITKTVKDQDFNVKDQDKD